MNILIKLMSIVSLVIAPTLAQVFHTKDTQGVVEKKVEIHNESKVADNSKNTIHLADVSTKPGN